MARSAFSKRFRQLVADMSDTELGYILGVSADAARKIRNGGIKSLKLHAALRLASQLRVSPWYLAGEPEPEKLLRDSSPQASVRGMSTKRNRSVDREQRVAAQGQDDASDGLVELRGRVQRLEATVRALQATRR